jgi:SM-20-related protein
MIYFDESVLDTIADTLVEQGYIVIEKSLPEKLLHSLLDNFNQLRDEEFKAAGVGRHSDFQLQQMIRSDKIHWIANTTETTAEFLHWMDVLRVGINRRLFLGLFDYESHFAHYPVGAFYKKHLDAFRENQKQGQANRVLSTVLYLNEDWQPQSGGELVIYSEDDEIVMEKLSPEFGRLVIFLSEKFPHEVLPANRERKSIAGWFRVNESAC